MGKEERSVINIEPWINLKDACAYTALSIDRLRRAYLSKESKFSKVSGRVLTKKSWLDEWLAK